MVTAIRNSYVNNLNNKLNVNKLTMARNNCFINSVYHNSVVDIASIRANISSNIASVIKTMLLNTSHDEEKAVFLYHLDFNYDLKLSHDIDGYINSDSTARNILQERIVFDTQSAINNGAMLDVVFAGQTLANTAGKDIKVNFNLGNNHAQYQIKSNSSHIIREEIVVQLSNEHFMPKAYGINFNYVQIMPRTLILLPVFSLLALDFMMFATILPHFKSKIIEEYFPTISTIYQSQEYNAEQLDSRREPEWQSIIHNPNRDAIARQYGYNDFYQLATDQNNRKEAQKNASEVKDVATEIKGNKLSEEQKRTINDKFELAKGKEYSYAGKRINFLDIKDPVTQEEFIPTDDLEWCAIYSGKSQDGKTDIYTPILKDSLIANLENGNKKNPFTNLDLAKNDILMGEDLLKWLNQAEVAYNS